jgi:hypothetical protein
MAIRSPRVSILLGVLAAAGAAQLAAAVLERDQFAVGWPIELSGHGPFYDVPVTYEVYRYGRTVNELAVLDKAGNAMPFYRVELPAPTISEERTSLGVSPIYLQEEDGAVADVSVATRGDRTDVTVTQAQGETLEPEAVAFIIDARDAESIPHAFELEWRPLDQPFLMTVLIEHSTALSGWQGVGSGSVASLSIDGGTVMHNRVAVKGREGGYYRVTWDHRVSDWQLEGVSLISSRETEVAKRRTIDLSPIEVPKEHAVEDAVFFDVGGELPTTAAQLAFTGDSGWAAASLHWAKAIEGPWRRVARSHLFYDISYERERLESPPLRLGRIEARYWRVTFAPELAPPGIELRLQYSEENLRFAANGQPPYILVGGTHLEEAGPDPTFAAVVTALDQDQRPVAQANLGPRMVLGGESVLEPPMEFPWRSMLLWAALAVAGLAVGWMAIRLARELSGSNLSL